MNIKRYLQMRAIIGLFVALTVAISVTQDNILLGGVAVITGMIFLVLVRSRTKIIIDEREKTIRDKAAGMTYAIFAPTIGIGSFFLFILGRKYIFIQTLGQIFAYLTLFLITLYALSHFFYNRTYGGSTHDE